MTTFDAYWRKVCHLIETHGWAVQGVFGTEHTPSFSYTIGLSKLGLPEILAIGLPIDVAQSVLNNAASRLKAKEISIKPQDPIEELANLPLAFRQDTPSKSLRWLSKGATRWTTEHGGPPPSVIQLVYPDERGRFPWDPGCRQEIALLQDPDALAIALGDPEESPRPPSQLR